MQLPLHMLSVAPMCLGIWARDRGARIPAVRDPDVLFLPALAWLVYAAWELLVLVKAPEVNIRVDLLIIWPLFMLTTIWAAVIAFRS